MNPPPPNRSTSDDRGSGTVLGTALVMVLILLAVAALWLAQAAVAARQAATAADLAALAGADAARGLTGGQPCEVAAGVAAQHGAAVVTCTVVGPDGHIVDLRTAIEMPPPLGTATARSRAGPPP